MSQFRAFIGTLNNPKVDTHDYIEAYHSKHKAVYVTGQLEQGANGTPHIQFFVQFAKPHRMLGMKRYCAHANFQGVKVNNGADAYCNKEDTRVDGPWSYGIKPAQVNKKGDKARRNREIIEYGATKAVDEGLIRIDDLKKVKQSIDLYFQMKSDYKDLDRLDNHWYYGKTGTGKSKTARQKVPDAFLKTNTKWWDGYAQQESVLIEELGKDQIGGHHLKQWADHYPFPAETKGGSIQLRPKSIYVTSNYSIREVYPNEQDYEPLERRFQVHHFVNPFGNRAQ